MKKLSATIFSICLAAGSAGAWAQADTTKKGNTTDGMAKDSMKRAPSRTKMPRTRWRRARSQANTVPQAPTKGSSNTTEGMAKESMNKEALEKKDAQSRMDAGKSQANTTRDEAKKGAMDQDPMKKDKDGMKK